MQNKTQKTKKATANKVLAQQPTQAATKQAVLPTGTINKKGIATGGFTNTQLALAQKAQVVPNAYFTLPHGQGTICAQQAAQVVTPIAGATPSGRGITAVIAQIVAQKQRITYGALVQLVQTHPQILASGGGQNYKGINTAGKPYFCATWVQRYINPLKGKTIRINTPA